jgi:hypothetical protein
MHKLIFSIIFVLITSLSHAQCLVAQYNLNGNANDVSGNGNHGTINGCIANTDRFGNVNGSLHFDGINDFITVPASASLNLSSTMTFTTWFISHDPFVAGQTLIGRQRNSIDRGINLSFDNLSGKIELEDLTNYESATSSFGGYHMGKWHMLTATHDGTDTKIYIDGVLKTTEPGPISLPNITEPFEFGREGSFLGNYLHGDLDDIKIYNCALSAADIDSIFIAESPYEPCGFVVSAITLPPTCHDGNDGSINLSVSGSQPPYAFYWNNGQNTEDLSNLIPGNYSIIINDDNGCDTMITYNVFNPVSMNITLNITNPSCGMNNGNAIATVLNGGTGPFDYQWSSGDTLATADSLSAGIYMLTVTDPSGCTGAETFGVNNSGGLSLSAIVTDASCEGVFDGDINLTVSGGTSPYTYSWSDASTSEDLNNVTPGAYMVEVTDDNGCVAVLNTTIGSTSIDLSNVTLNSPSCGNSDGSISVIPSGGSSPYDYLWSSNAGSATSSSVTSLGAGNYFLTVTDDNGCAKTELFALSNSNGPTLVITSVNSSHCAGNTGNINIGITGGVSPFTYVWSNGETTQDISGLNAGNYSVEVTDDDGCVTSLNVNVPGITLDPITLCMSTVNDVNGKVLCIWEKPVLDYISYFNIYRENSVAGQYDYWFSRPYDSTSQWTDLTANPQIRGWRYKVTYVDTCGNESPFGTNHKTIHAYTSAGLSGGVNISWDHYEGFNFPTFYIERYHISTGWITIDSIPSTLHSYFDTTTLTGTLEYAINIQAPNTCDPTRVGVNTSRSNVRNQPTATPNEIKENKDILSFNVYPNPAKDEVFISIENKEAGEFELKIFNTIGELILVQKINSSNQRIDTKEIPNGFYTLEVSNEINSFVKKLIIQK